MRDNLARRIDTIETAYEFMLAYAAQGLASDAGSEAGGQVREFLGRATAAVDGIADVVTELVRQEGIGPAAPYDAFAEVLERDARASKAAIDLVLAQARISSQLVDNLNASIHLRALLTDLFLLDDILTLSP